MTTSVLLERSNPAAAPFGQPGAFPAGSPAAGNFCILPRCKFTFEKCTGGLKFFCKCDDEVSSGALQNLCRMLSDGLCSCSCTFNGIQVCQCSFTMGTCKCEFTKDGCCISCTSGDKACCAMLQSFCDCLETCCKSGCCCYVSFNSTPICCGTC